MTTNTTDDVRSRVSENCFVSPGDHGDRLLGGPVSQPRRLDGVLAGGERQRGRTTRWPAARSARAVRREDRPRARASPTTAVFTLSKSATTLGDICPESAIRRIDREQRAEVVLGLCRIVEAEQRPCAHPVRAHERRARLRLLRRHRLERDDRAREERDGVLVVELLEQPLALRQIRVPSPRAPAHREARCRRPIMAHTAITSSRHRRAIPLMRRSPSIPVRVIGRSAPAPPGRRRCTSARPHRAPAPSPPASVPAAVLSPPANVATSAPSGSKHVHLGSVEHVEVSEHVERHVGRVHQLVAGSLRGDARQRLAGAVEDGDALVVAIEQGDLLAGTERDAARANRTRTDRDICPRRRT